MKAARTFVIILITLLIPVSCALMKPSQEKDTFTSSEAAYAMKEVMKEVHSNTLASFYKYLASKADYVPENYKVLAEQRHNIVGMDTILENWQKSASETALDAINYLKPQVEQWINDLDFEDPLDFITSSDTSGSVLFETLYKEELTKLVEEQLQGLDLSNLKQAVYYYNAAAKVKNVAMGNKITMLEDVDTSVISVLARMITEEFFKDFYSSEELYRTTPNPYADSTVASVFGLT